jgi:hypothetical protein
MAVPLDISASEPLVAARTLPAEEGPVIYLLQKSFGEHWFNLNRTTGELTLHDEALQRTAAHTGTSVIKIYGASSLKPKLKFDLCYYFSYVSDIMPEFCISIMLMACVFLCTNAIMSIRTRSLLCSEHANLFVSPLSPMHRSLDQSVSPSVACTLSEDQSNHLNFSPPPSISRSDYLCP